MTVSRVFSGLTPKKLVVWYQGKKKLFGQTFNKHSFCYHIFLPIYHCMARAVWKFSLYHVEINMKYFALFSVSGVVLLFFLVFCLFSAICAWNIFACQSNVSPRWLRKHHLKSKFVLPQTYIALIPSRLTCQMLANFLEVEF